MKNKFEDLHNHLFAQLERLNEDDLKGDELKEEIIRANAVTSVASQIISNGNLILSAYKIKANGFADTDMPQLFVEKKE